MIEYETADGRWHSETAAGNDRPETDVEGCTGSRHLVTMKRRCDRLPASGRTKTAALLGRTS